MTDKTLLVALTKRAVAKQLRRAGSPKKEAEAVVARLPFNVLRGKLPTDVYAEIAWKAATARRIEQ